MGGIEETDGPADPGRRRTTWLSERAAMVVVASVACVLWGFPAVATHQEAAGRLAGTVAAPAPSPAIVSVLVPGDPPVAVDPTPAPAPADDAPPITLPLAPVPPPAAAASAPVKPIGSYSFEVTSPNGSPARWDPCVVVHYVVNLTHAPPGALADLDTAVAIVSQSTGLHFVDDGTTTAPLETSWISSGPIGANGWPDVLIGWSSPGQTDLKLTAAMGGITEYEAASLPGGGSALVDAVVVLSAPNDPGAGFGPNARGALLLHELGHAVGLGHVNDTTQIMNPVSTGAAGVYGTGDLAGLRILGAGACLAAPARAQTNIPRAAPEPTGR
jgi:hypothetical protein